MPRVRVRRREVYKNTINRIAEKIWRPRFSYHGVLDDEVYTVDLNTGEINYHEFEHPIVLSQLTTNPEFYKGNSPCGFTFCYSHNMTRRVEIFGSVDATRWESGDNPRPFRYVKQYRRRVSNLNKRKHTGVSLHVFAKNE